MRQFEPCTGKSLAKFIRIFVKAFRDFAVSGVHFHRHIGIGHDGVAANGWVFYINRFVFFFDVDGFPLPCTCRTLFELPVIGEQQIEIAVVPFGWMGCPCAFNAANEEAVAAFLNKQIRFTDIARVVSHCLERNVSGSLESIEALLQQDAETRACAQQHLAGLGV